MFQQLSQMLANKADTFSVTVAREDATQLRVTILPKLAGDKQLNRPVALTGTPEELDSPDFLAKLTGFTDSVVDLRAALDEAEKANKAAAATTRTNTAAKKSKTPPAKPSKPAAKASPAKKADPKKNPLLRRKGVAAAKPAQPAPKPEPEPAEPAAPKNAEEATQSLI
jgi:PRTRC genetic system protein E